MTEFIFFLVDLFLVPISGTKVIHIMPILIAHTSNKTCNGVMVMYGHLWTSCGPHLLREMYEQYNMISFVSLLDRTLLVLENGSCVTFTVKYFNLINQFYSLPVFQDSLSRLRVDVH